MRLIAYTSFLVFCCSAIQSVETDRKNYKYSKNDDDFEIRTKHKYKNLRNHNSLIDDSNNEEDYRQNKYTGTKQRDQRPEFIKEKKYSKYTKNVNKFMESDEDTNSYKKRSKYYINQKYNEDNGRKQDKKKTKNLQDYTDEDINEEIDSLEKEKVNGNYKEEKKKFRTREKGVNNVEPDKNKKYINKIREGDKEDDDSGENSDNNNRKFKENYIHQKYNEDNGRRQKEDKKKTRIVKDYSDEDINEEIDLHEKEKFNENYKEEKKEFAKRENGVNNVEPDENKKYINKRREGDKEDDDSGENSDNSINKFEENLKEIEQEEVDGDDTHEAAKKFRKKIRVRVPDSPSDDSDNLCNKFQKGKKNRKNCLNENIHEESNEEQEDYFRKKKIKYSIKFAHEKQKAGPNENGNIMMKIHRGEKKKNRYQDDDDDNSSEEDCHPKRISFFDDEED